MHWVHIREEGDHGGGRSSVAYTIHTDVLLLTEAHNCSIHKARIYIDV